MRTPALRSTHSPLSTLPALLAGPHPKVVMADEVNGSRPARHPGSAETVDLRLLRCFVAVADAGSVTAAAQELYASQPSVSRQLHRLEREIGLVLFRPVDGRLVITAAGRELLPRARTLLATATAVRNFARDTASGAMTAVQIAAPAVIAYDVLPAFIAASPRNLSPLAVRSTPPERLYEALHGDADIVVGENVPPGHLAVAVLARRTVHAFVPATHELVNHGSVTLTELVEHDLLVPDPRRHLRRLLDEATAEEGLVYRPAGEYDCPPVALANAAAGWGVAIACGTPAFDLVALPIIAAGGPMTAPLFAAWPVDHHAESSLADLAVELSEFLGGRNGPAALTDSNDDGFGGNENHAYESVAGSA